jgi:hypothetical protein
MLSCPGDGEHLSLDIRLCPLVEAETIGVLGDGSDGDASSDDSDEPEDTDTSDTSSDSESDVLDFDELRSVVSKMDEDNGEGLVTPK